MRRIILGLTVSLMFGCAYHTVQVDEIKTQQMSSSISLDRYQDSGVQFYLKEYSGKSKILGVMEMTVFPGISFRTVSSDPNGSDQVVEHFDWVRTPYDAQLAADSIYRWGKALGANAIQDFKVTFTHIAPANSVLLIGVNVYGVAIKKED